MDLADLCEICDGRIFHQHSAISCIFGRFQLDKNQTVQHRDFLPSPYIQVDLDIFQFESNIRYILFLFR